MVLICVSLVISDFVRVGHLSILFGETYIQVLQPFFLVGLFGFFLLLSCVSSLYIFDINSLSDMRFANTSSHSVGCPCQKYLEHVCPADTSKNQED